MRPSRRRGSPSAVVEGVLEDVVGGGVVSVGATSVGTGLIEADDVGVGAVGAGPSGPFDAPVKSGAAARSDEVFAHPTSAAAAAPRRVRRLISPDLPMAPVCQWCVAFTSERVIDRGRMSCENPVKLTWLSDANAMNYCGLFLGASSMIT